MKQTETDVSHVGEDTGIDQHLVLGLQELPEFFGGTAGPDLIGGRTSSISVFSDCSSACHYTDPYTY